jgi:diguanylate cyclase (GGDEF)-like protein
MQNLSININMENIFKLEEFIEHNNIKNLNNNILLNLEDLKELNKQQVECWINGIKLINNSLLILENCSVYMMILFNQVKKTLPINYNIKSFYIPYQAKSGNSVTEKLYSFEKDFKKNRKINLELFKEPLLFNNQEHFININITNYLHPLQEFELNKWSNFDNFFDGVVVIDETKKIKYINEVAASIIGLSTKRILNKSPCFYDIIEIDDPLLFCTKSGIEGKDKTSLYKEVYFSSKKTSKGALQISICPDNNQNFIHKRWLVYIKDITLEKKLTSKYLDESNKQVETLKQLDEAAIRAETDDMTSLMNFRAFKRVLEYELQDHKRKNKVLSLVLLDVDKFKIFNDTYGHQQGDEVLRNVAKVLTESTRNTDYVFRYGGEEFTMVLPNTDFDGLGILMEKVRKNLEQSEVQYLNHPGQTLKVTSSFGGVTIKPEELEKIIDIDQKTFIEIADKNLYQAKESGRNCCIKTVFKQEEEEVE